MITTEQYQNFLKAITDDIEGDWVLVGGALMAILSPPGRATADIDLCPIGELTNERRIQLMQLAQASGLSIDSINPSADFFLRQIPNWHSSITVFMKGRRGNLYRPSLELYIRMKIGRLTESDVQDCISFIRWHIQTATEYDSKAIVNLIEQREKTETNDGKLTSLNALKEALAKN